MGWAGIPVTDGFGFEGELFLDCWGQAGEVEVDAAEQGRRSGLGGKVEPLSQEAILDESVDRMRLAVFRKRGLQRRAEGPVMALVCDRDARLIGEIRALIDAGAATFPRSTPSGCTPAFMAWLAGMGRQDVIIGGISIDNCTLHTTLDLLRAGYNVQVVVDVSGSNSKLAEDAAIARLQAAGAVNSGWLNTLTGLGSDFAGPHGPGMMGIIQSHWPASTVGTVADTTPDGRGMQLPA